MAIRTYTSANSVCVICTCGSHKEEKYANIGSQYLFASIAVETLGSLNTSACQIFGTYIHIRLLQVVKRNHT